jgi:excisionase family DNA binding protein
MNTDPQFEWLTTNQAAEYLKVKPRSLLLWARQGKIKGYTLSGTRRRIWRFRREDLDSALLHSHVVRSDPLTVLELERRNS